MFSVDELKDLMNVVHDVKYPNTVQGNTKASWHLLEFRQDMKVDFKDFILINKKFPRIFHPAFR